MCLTDATFSESRPCRKLDEPPGGRLRHWGRAALELRRARRGSARIPLRGNPGNASTSKASGKVSREPGSAVTRAFSGNLKKASEAAAGAGATRETQEEEKSPAPPQSSISLWQVGGQGLGIRGDRRDLVVSNNLGKTSDQANYSQRKKKKEGIEARTKIKHRLAPSLKSYFRTRPEDIVLVPGQGKMDTFVVKDIGSGTDSGKGAEEGFPSLVANLPLHENIQVGTDADVMRQGGILSTPRQEESGLVAQVVSPPARSN
ncbi:hypothetical protein NDU88_005061 [Pleurodeles waltl]|uniref:Uncharacterized protein n=1 Tax=Pleurodeles waltl TaxID=8319 RepID=A0AAV7MB09_PLEWA|nr:hypothetical protein NDU88_005061 [Pleurodeles waltl]